MKAKTRGCTKCKKVFEVQTPDPKEHLCDPCYEDSIFDENNRVVFVGAAVSRHEDLNI